MALSHLNDTDVPAGLPLPHWSWDGLQPYRAGWQVIPVRASWPPQPRPARLPASSPLSASQSVSVATPGGTSSRPSKKRLTSSWLRGRIRSAPEVL